MLLYRCSGVLYRVGLEEPSRHFVHGPVLALDTYNGNVITEHGRRWRLGERGEFVQGNIPSIPLRSRADKHEPIKYVIWPWSEHHTYDNRVCLRHVGGNDQRHSYSVMSYGNLYRGSSGSTGRTGPVDQNTKILTTPCKCCVGVMMFVISTDGRMYTYDDNEKWKFSPYDNNRYLGTVMVLSPDGNANLLPVKRDGTLQLLDRNGEVKEVVRIEQLGEVDWSVFNITKA